MRAEERLAALRRELAETPEVVLEVMAVEVLAALVHRRRMLPGPACRRCVELALEGVQTKVGIGEEARAAIGA